MNRRDHDLNASDVFSLVLTLQTRYFMLNFMLEHLSVRHVDTDIRLVAARYMIQVVSCKSQDRSRITGPASHVANNTFKLEYCEQHRL